MQYQTIAIEVRDSFAWCKLNRPDVRNAFNQTMIEELTDFAKQITTEIRAVVLYGEGPVFCAGGDLNWMQRSLELNHQQNQEDATRLASMYSSLDQIPAPVIGLIHGAAMGGGVGLVCICDYAIAVRGAQFSFSEVRLGIVPACIAPFVLRKIGPGAARALFTTAEKFDTTHALRIGLVHELAENLDEAKTIAAKKLEQISQCGPNALRIAKQLIAQLVAINNEEEKLRYVAELLATVRVSEEGQEGLRAFLEKRKPSWIGKK